MEETIIIYTKYFSEAVIQVIDTYDLSVQIMCFSSYDKTLHYTRITPNLRGVIFLEHKPNRSAFKAYKEILTAADEIAGSSHQPFCVSIISNTDIPRKFISQITTSNLEIVFTKFLMFNTDLLRFEGIASVIVNTIGVANENILLEIEQAEGASRAGVGNNKTDFLTYCLQITTLPLEELSSLRDATNRFPELEKLWSLRHHSDLDESVLSKSDNLFKVFARQCIARREYDEEQNSRRY